MCKIYCCIYRIGIKINFFDVWSCFDILHTFLNETFIGSQAMLMHNGGGVGGYMYHPHHQCPEHRHAMIMNDSGMEGVEGATARNLAEVCRVYTSLVEFMKIPP